MWQYVIITLLRAFNKLHSRPIVHVSSAWLRVFDRWLASKVKRGYIVITVAVDSLHYMTHLVQLHLA